MRELANRPKRHFQSTSRKFQSTSRVSLGVPAGLSGGQSDPGISGLCAERSLPWTQVAWKMAKQRNEELDHSKETAIASADRKRWIDKFKETHGFHLPPSRTPHDLTLGLIKRQIDTEQMQFIPLSKVKVFGETVKPKAMDLSVNGQKLVATESGHDDPEPMKAHLFIRNLEVLMNGSVLAQVITYQAAVDHVTFFADKVFPKVPSDRIPLAQAMQADEDLRQHWFAQVRMESRTLTKAMEESRPMMVSLMNRQISAPSVAPRDPQGLKRTAPPPVQPLTVSKYPRGDQATSMKPWNFKNPSGKQYCFNWNAGKCTKSDSECERDHHCAVCGKKECRAMNHANYFRPGSFKGAKGGGK